MANLVHVDNPKKDILILNEGLDDTTLTAEKIIQLILLNLGNNFL